MALGDFLHHFNRSPGQGKSKAWADKLLRARDAAERRTKNACAAAHYWRGGAILREHFEAYKRGTLALLPTLDPPRREEALARLVEKESQVVPPTQWDEEHNAAIEAQTRIEESGALRAAYDRHLLGQVRKAARKDRARRQRIARLLRNLSRMTPEQIADCIIDGEGLAQIVAFDGVPGVRRHLQELLRKPSAYARDFIETLRQSAFGAAASVLSVVQTLRQAAHFLVSRLRSEEPIPTTALPPPWCSDSNLAARIARFRATA